VSVPSNPSATVPSSVTSDANGLFTIPGVPAGVTLQINVSKPTALDPSGNAIAPAYSTTSLVATVPAGQTLAVFPVLHEGCFQVVNPADAGPPVSLVNAQCASPRGGTYTSMTFGPGSFDDPVANALWTGSVRIEMIPLQYPAFPADAGDDLSWAVGLPGVATPPGLLGAAEYRVVKSTGGSDDGEVLSLHSGAHVSIAVPVYAGPSGSASAYSYSTTTGAWTPETPTVSGVQDGGPPVEYVTMQVPHLTWWAATNGATASTCVTGSLQAGGPIANALVHGVGSTFLGSSTGVTNSTGTFCLDMPVGTGGGNVQLFTSAVAGGVVYSGVKTFQVSAFSTGGTCASNSGCTAVGAITLSPSVTCVSGTITNDDGGAPPPSLAVEIENISTAEYASSSGILNYAYAGQTQIGTGGAFCALAPPGSEIRLTASLSSGCSAPKYQGTIPVPNGTGGTCGGGGCTDAGPLTFSCDLGTPQ
jgi:hypothetical protein